MNLAGIFIVPDVTAHVSVQIVSMGNIGPWETEWISITITTGPDSLPTLKTFIRNKARDEVITRFSLTQDSDTQT